MTSNAALQEVKRLFNARKAGHTGSLDPLASGLLPICLGEATKISAYLLAADKTYQFVCQLGISTTTGDSEGSIVEQNPVPELQHERLQKMLTRFLGPIQQLPPMYSALKHQGKRLYALARQGIEVQRQARTVHIYELCLLAVGETSLECITRCSKGTYIRTLGEDIGAALGCGAHISTLRRTGVGRYDAAHMIALDTLRDCARQGYRALDALLVPVDNALLNWPAVYPDSDSVHSLRNGQPVYISSAPESGWLRLYDQDKLFFAIGEVLADGRIAPRRLIRHASAY